MAYDITGGKCLSAMSPEIPHQEIEQEHFQSYIAILIDAQQFQNAMLMYDSQIPVFRGEIFHPHPELINVLRLFMLEAGEGGKMNIDFLDQLSSVIIHLIIRSVITEQFQKVALYDRFEVDRAINYMNTHISEKITLEKIAERVNLSAGHFTKIFKSVTGDTPIEYLNKLRLQKARKMLMNDVENITEIALQCGFNSSSYFSYCFLESYNLTPSAFRQQFVKRNESTVF